MVKGRDPGAKLLWSALPLIGHVVVLGWAPGKEALRQRFLCRRLIGGYSGDQYMCKGTG